MGVLVRPTGESGWLEVDFSATLAAGETISTAEHTVPEGLSVNGTGLGTGNLTARIRLGGGVHGATYQVRTRATTTAGNIVERVWTYRAANL